MATKNCEEHVPPGNLKKKNNNIIMYYAVHVPSGMFR